MIHHFNEMNGSEIVQLPTDPVVSNPQSAFSALTDLMRGSTGDLLKTMVRRIQSAFWATSQDRPSDEFLVVTITVTANSIIEETFLTIDGIVREASGSSEINSGDAVITQSQAFSDQLRAALETHVYDALGSFVVAFDVGMILDRNSKGSDWGLESVYQKLVTFFSPTSPLRSIVWDTRQNASAGVPEHIRNYDFENYVQANYS
jgi:hypothetical protein